SARMENNGDRPFKVADRRRITASGEPPEPEGAAAPRSAAAADDAPRDGPATPGTEKQRPTRPQTTACLTFVFSPGSSALVPRGDAPNPETGKLEKNLVLARETIDVLSMLQEKTKGNLTPEEERFLGSLLYDLPLRYVEAVRG